MRPLPHPRPSVSPNLEKGKPWMERDNSLLVEQQCHENMGLGWQTFIVMATLLNDFFLSPRLTKIKKKVRELLEPPPTDATLFTTPALGPRRKPKEAKSLSRHFSGPGPLIVHNLTPLGCVSKQNKKYRKRSMPARAPSLTASFSSMLAPPAISVPTSSALPAAAASTNSPSAGITPACAPNGESVTQGIAALSAKEAPEVFGFVLWR